MTGSFILRNGCGTGFVCFFFVIVSVIILYAEANEILSRKMLMYFVSFVARNAWQIFCLAVDNGIISAFYVSQEMLCHRLADLHWFRSV